MAVVVLALGMAGCGTTDQFGGQSGSSSASFADRVGRMFSTGTSTAQSLPEQDAKTEYECPSVTIRTGAAAHQVVATGRDGSPQGLRYQVTFGQTARECAALGQVMTMKVGIEGRMLSGPAGGAGKIDVPVRIAVVHEGPTPKTVWTKFYRIPVQMPEGQTQTSFIHVEEDLSFPLPKAEDLENYIVFVGFDPKGEPEKPSRQPRRPARTG